MGFRFIELRAQQFNLGVIGRANPVPAGAGKTPAVVFNKAGRPIFILRAAFQAIASNSWSLSYLFESRDGTNTFIVESA